MNRVVALTFHAVVADGQEAPAGSAVGDPFYRIRAGELEQLIAEIHQLGCQTISSRTFRTWQAGRGALPERAVVLTFDGGYANHFEIAAPLLLRHRCSATFFIAVERLGRAGYLTWEQLRKLVFLGMEIGSHGLLRRPLTALSPEELVRELSESKRRLEQWLGVPVRALAVPGGFWNRTVSEAAREAGYDAVWASTIGTNGLETNPQALRRVVVRPGFSTQRIVSMVEGWQPAFWWAANQQQAIRTLKRLLGVYRYEQLKRLLVPNA